LRSELHVVDDARGFYIVTASTGTQPAREMALSPDGVVMGHFTAALVNGIESGAADQGRKGKILLSDLRHYLGQVVTKRGNFEVREFLAISSTTWSQFDSSTRSRR
jgi:hypothetical protein